MSRAKTTLALLALLFLSPPLLGQTVGQVQFANSGAAAAQADFLHGLAQLHNFEYEDAAAAFQRAEKADPGFAMAYWGEAMTANHPIWQEQDLEAGRAALARLAATPAERAARAGSDREKAYLAAVEVLYGAGTKEDRDARYAAAMGELAGRYPEDVDAQAFYALSLLGTAHEGRDIPTYMRSAAVLEEVLCRAPEHPGVLHYLIHSYDDPQHAPLGLRAARRYARVAPDAGHAQHMTSHIFLALGLWDETVDANLAAMAAVNRAREARGMHHRSCGHYAFWLHYGYLQQGRFGEARKVLDACRDEAQHAGHSGSLTMRKGSDPLDPDTTSLGSFAAMRLRHLLDTGEWSSEVASWPVEPGDLLGARLTLDFTAAFAALEAGRLEEARAAAGRFEAARRDLEVELAKASSGSSNQRKRAEILSLELAARLAWAEGQREPALATLERAAAEEDGLPFAFGPPFVDEPSHELLGELLLAAGKPAEAEKAFERALARAPRRVRSLLGLARAQKAAGHPEAAGETSALLHQIRHAADRELEAPNGR
ncbi:MAG: tetratricopeptide repeat protein [Thermoanaerobaculia bacterium]